MKIQVAFSSRITLLALTLLSTAMVNSFFFTESWAGPASIDPLFSKMVGKWNASGVRRTSTAKGPLARTEVHAFAEARVDDHSGRLVSSNQLIETVFDENGVEGAQRVYERVYWIEASEGGNYRLGNRKNGQDEGAMSQGRLGEDGIFRVTQIFGGGYAIDSETRFEGENASVYREVFTNNGRKLAETELHYSRAE